MLKVADRLPRARRGADDRRSGSSRRRRSCGRRCRSTSCRRSRRRCRQVYVDPSLISYAVDVATATRQPVDTACRLATYVAYGASPRGPISLVQAARALARRARARLRARRGRAGARRRTRFGTASCSRYQALAEEVTADSILERVLATVPLPQLDLGRTSAGVTSSAPCARAARRIARARADAGRAAARARRHDRAPRRGHARRRLPLGAARPGHGARADPAVRAGRRRPPASTGTSPRARGEPHVRVQLAERVLVTWLVLDTSPSMQFGTADRRKADVAEGVALAVGHVATRRGNRLGIVTFGGADPRSEPPRQGRGGLIGLLADAPRGRRGRAERRDVARRGVPAGGRARAAALARGRRLRLPRPVRLAQPAAAAGRPPRRDRGRGPRPARGGAAERRRPLARRPRDRPTSCASTRATPSFAARFAEAAAEERSGLARTLAALGVRHVVALDAGRLAARARGVPARRAPAVTFEWPLALLALLVVPVLVVLYVRRERRRNDFAKRVREPGTAAEPRPATGRAQRHVPLVLLLLALSTMLVGVARPHATVSVPREEATIIVAIDVSTSMTSKDVPPTRLVAARRAARAFVRDVPRSSASASCRSPVARSRSCRRPSTATAFEQGLAVLQARRRHGARRRDPPLVDLARRAGAARATGRRRGDRRWSSPTARRQWAECRRLLPRVVPAR